MTISIKLMDLSEQANKEDIFESHLNVLNCSLCKLPKHNNKMYRQKKEV